MMTMSVAVSVFGREDVFGMLATLRASMGGHS